MHITRRHFFQRFFKQPEAAAAERPALSFRPASAEPYIGEVLLTGINFAPRGWMTCDGQLLAIAQNTALFSILGTTYGGDGRTTFGLPNLNGRAVLGTGQGPGLTDRSLGESGGINTVTLTNSEIPARSVTVNQVEVRGVGGTQGVGLAKGSVISTGTATVAVSNSPTAVNHTPPYLGLLYIIAVQGIFPPRS